MIRRAGPEDAIRLADLHAAAFAEPWTAAALTALIADPFVAAPMAEHGLSNLPQRAQHRRSWQQALREIFAARP